MNHSLSEGINFGYVHNYIYEKIILIDGNLDIEVLKKVLFKYIKLNENLLNVKNLNNHNHINFQFLNTFKNEFNEKSNFNLLKEKIKEIKNEVKNNGKYYLIKYFKKKEIEKFLFFHFDDFVSKSFFFFFFFFFFLNILFIKLFF